MKKLLILLVLLCSCIENPVVPKNMPPVVKNISLDYNSGGGGVLIQLTVIDPEGDTLFYSWATNYGTLYASQDHARWVGNAKGTYYVTIIITDGTNTVTRIIEVKKY